MMSIWVSEREKEMEEHRIISIVYPFIISLRTTPAVKNSFTYPCFNIGPILVLDARLSNDLVDSLFHTPTNTNRQDHTTSNQKIKIKTHRIKKG